MSNTNLFEPKIIEGKTTAVSPDKFAKIAVIGVGDGGYNMLNHMTKEGIHKIDLIVSNTDLQALRTSEVPIRIQLGPNLTIEIATNPNYYDTPPFMRGYAIKYHIAANRRILRD